MPRAVSNLAILALIFCAFLIVVDGVSANGNRTNPNHHDVLNSAKIGGKPKRQDPILYHGGPVMLGTINIYTIFYGSWNESAQLILTDFFLHISSSAYWNIEKLYQDGKKRHITGPVVRRLSILDKYSKGKRLTDTSLADILKDRFREGLVQDENGLYFILTSGDVQMAGFCKKFCGFHTNLVVGTKHIKYAFIGSPQACMKSCADHNRAVSPNGNPPIDAMVSVVAHELVEAVTDPRGNAWFDRRGNEVADKCAFSYGQIHKNTDGSVYNLQMGNRRYLVQQTWDPIKQRCAVRP